MRYLLKVIYFAVIVLLQPVLAVSAGGRMQDMDDNIVIVIDPGHGGENEGTIENGFQEKSMTLHTALAMQEALEAYDGITVYLTRADDQDLTLRQRAEFARDVGADFLFSIHYNASPQHNLFGSEVWISAQPPFNARGYQFGFVHQQIMKDMGIFLRGVKTRLNDKGTDYYGIIREAAALEIPAVIIEHCHVDEERDVPFCDTPEKLEVFGRADAEAVAKYFGLRSDSLSADYSGYPFTLPEASPETAVERSLKDETAPDVCLIALDETDYETGLVRINVSAADYDSMLIYYDYSIDGGETYSPLEPWPESNALTGAYADTFSLELTIPSGSLPDIQVRAYNLFDGFTESNMLSSFQVFRYGEEKQEEGESAEPGASDGADRSQQASAGEISGAGGDNSAPAASDSTKSRTGKLLDFLTICLICVVILFVTVLLFQYLTYRSRKKRRRQRRNVDGDSRNQPR